MQAVALEVYRRSPQEQERQRCIESLMRGSTSLLDAGAREGYYSQLFADRFRQVIALDLKPLHLRDCDCLAGDLTRLPLRTGSIETVLCTEVLEHIPDLHRACAELSRVASSYIVIGVPYRQDIRIGRVTCHRCGTIGPPWGHVNSFSEEKLARLFPEFRIVDTRYVGRQREGTDPVATWLMDFGGNPWGTYDDTTCCVRCDERPEPPVLRSFIQRAAAVAALRINGLHERLNPARPIWIHMLFERRTQHPRS